MVIRARVFQNGLLPSKIITNTYFINESSTLPIISLSTNPANFFDNAIGIYVVGPNAEETEPFYGANFWEDWERPIHIEFFEPDGQLGFSIDAGVKIHGGCSRSFPKNHLELLQEANTGVQKFLTKSLIICLMKNTIQLFYVTRVMIIIGLL